jgi:hypothetical protein
MSTVKTAVWVTTAVGEAVRTIVSVTRCVSGGEDRDTVSVVVGGRVTVWTTVTAVPPEPPFPPDPAPELADPLEPEPPSIGTTEYLGARITALSACCSLIGSEYEKG